jgi:hypothetical protein
MKAEWIHTDDGLTLSVTAQSDADRVNFTAFYRGKPVKPLLRVTKTIKESNGDYSGLQVAFIQPLSKRILQPLGFTVPANSPTNSPFRLYKLYGNTLILLFNSGVVTVKKIIYNDNATACNMLIEVVEALVNNNNIEAYDGSPIIFVGTCRSIGGLKKLIGKNI